MSKLDRAANVALIALCAFIVFDIATRHVPARQDSQLAQQAGRAPQPPPAYLIGQAFPPTGDFHPQVGARSLLMIVRDGCKYCEASAPFYRRLATVARSAPGSVRLVGLCLNPTDVCAQYFKQRQVAVDSAVGVKGTDVRISGTPTLVLLDRADKVAGVWLGQQSAAGEEAIVRALQQGN